MSEPLTIMAVVCHPADAIDLAGGTLCLQAQRGDHVTVVVCTHGVDTHHWRRLDEIQFEGRSESGANPADAGVALGDKEREVSAGLAVVDKKVKAMDCLQSQYYPGNLARKVIADVNGRMGDSTPGCPTPRPSKRSIRRAIRTCRPTNTC